MENALATHAVAIDVAIQDLERYEFPTIGAVRRLSPAKTPPVRGIKWDSRTTPHGICIQRTMMADSSRRIYAESMECRLQFRRSFDD
jgi:hypothetical protein